jgi:hypothetical protein
MHSKCSMCNCRQVSSVTGYVHVGRQRLIQWHLCCSLYYLAFLLPPMLSSTVGYLLMGSGCLFGLWPMLQAGLNADFPSSPTAAGAAVAAVKAAAKEREAAALPGSSLWPIKCKAQVIGPSFAYVSPGQVLAVPAQGHISIFRHVSGQETVLVAGLQQAACNAGNGIQCASHHLLQRVRCTVLAASLQHTETSLLDGNAVTSSFIYSLYICYVHRDDVS